LTWVKTVDGNWSSNAGNVGTKGSGDRAALLRRDGSLTWAWSKSPTVPKWEMRSMGLAWGVLLLVLGVAGCTHTAPYPKDWAAITEVPSGQCPRIDGRYLNAEIDESEGCFTDSPIYPSKCNIGFLSTTLLEFGKHQSEINRARASRWIELKQPDDNTLVIELEKGGAPVVLRQSDGDFACSSEGPTLTGSRSTDLGHRTNYSRSFRRLEDRSLTMKVTTYGRGVHPILLPIPIPPFVVPMPVPIPDFGTRSTGYFRWPAFAPAQESRPASP
jgi:hypothetical protein